MSGAGVRRSFLVVLGVAAFGGFCYLLLMYMYVEYVPVEMTFRGGDCVIINRPDLLTPEHVERMKQILDDHNEPYRLRHGRLLIHGRLQHDRDLLSNYTRKAEDLKPAQRTREEPK